MSAGGRFIVLEGPDGAGKTTQAGRLVAALERRAGLAPALVREPGATRIGERIREILLDPAHETFDPRAELFLYMAARVQLCREVIAPALAAGRIVIADRFLASSAVYQGIAGGVGIERVLELGSIATDGLAPDLTIILDLEAEAAAERVARGRERDRMERKSLDYHRRVCSGYREYARLAKEPVRVIDAARAPDEVFADVLAAVEAVIVPGPKSGARP
jgi:dTMP kinase